MYAFLISLSGKHLLICEMDWFRESMTPDGNIRGLGLLQSILCAFRKTSIIQIIELSVYWTIVKDISQHGR